MSKVQEMRTIIFNKRGERKIYTKLAVFLPKFFDEILNVEKGDEIKFKINFDNRNEGTFRIIKNKILKKFC